MATRDLIPIPFLRECLSYDAETGVLRWRERPRSHFFDDRAHRIWNTRWARTEAASRQIAIRINGEQRYIGVHRAAWALTKGEYPPGEIVRSDDNRFKALKPLTHAQIQQRPHARGAYIDYRTGRFRAEITINRRQLYLGTFDTEAEAHQAYLDAKLAHYPSTTLY
jgi:AP2 domain